MSIHILLIDSDRMPLPAGFSETLQSLKCIIHREAPGKSMLALAARIHIDAVIILAAREQDSIGYSDMAHHLIVPAGAPVLCVDDGRSLARLTTNGMLDSFKIHHALACIFAEHGAPLMEPEISAGPLRVDQTARCVEAFGLTVEIGPRPFELLNYLMRRPHMAFSRAKLYNALWTGGDRSQPRIVDVNIMRLRQALGEAGVKNPIRTLRGAGYKFESAPRNPAFRAARSRAGALRHAPQSIIHYNRIGTSGLQQV
jgi:DNA-binding winged helix-turn-helix (wHTH) protein